MSQTQRTTRSDYPQLYGLTEMTGRRSAEDRTFVIQGFEAKRRHGMIFLAGLLPAFVMSLIFWPLLSEYAIVIGVGVEVALFALLEFRSSKGLKLRSYQAIYDRKRAINNKFVICGNLIDPINMSPGWIRQSSVPVDQFRDTSADEVDVADTILVPQDETLELPAPGRTPDRGPVVESPRPERVRRKRRSRKPTTGLVVDIDS